LRSSATSFFSSALDRDSLDVRTIARRERSSLRSGAIDFSTSCSVCRGGTTGAGGWTASEGLAVNAGASSSSIAAEISVAVPRRPLRT
jgi:hypothetical protein